MDKWVFYVFQDRTRCFCSDHNTFLDSKCETGSGRERERQTERERERRDGGFRERESEVSLKEGKSKCSCFWARRQPNVDTVSTFVDVL